MEIDKNNMKKVIEDFPHQLKESFKISKEIEKKAFKNVVICGLGGSALPGEIIRYLYRNIPLYIQRDYGLPKEADKNSLVICISYSGNTEETISALKESLKKRLVTVGISTGGEIEKICKNIPHIKIPSGIQPRSATGYLFIAAYKALVSANIIKNNEKEISKATNLLKKERQEVKGKKLSEKIKNKIPIIYASRDLNFLARIWKIKFNENSKVPSFFNYFPELNHNEMVGFTNKEKNKNFFAIILKDEKDKKENIKRMEVFSKIMKFKKLDSIIVEVKGENKIYKIFSSIILGDWASYYLALLHNVDPTPVKIIEEFKKKIK